MTSELEQTITEDVLESTLNNTKVQKKVNAFYYCIF